MFNNENIIKALEDALNENEIFVINSKERVIPFESSLFTMEVLKRSNKKPLKLLLSSDNRQSNKSVTCIALALAQAYYNPNSRILFITENRKMADLMINELGIALDTLNELNNEIIGCVRDYNKSEFYFGNNSLIRFKSMNSAEFALRGQTYDLIIIDNAHSMDEYLYTIINSTFKELLIMNVTNTLIHPDSFINKIL